MQRQALCCFRFVYFYLQQPECVGDNVCIVPHSCCNLARCIDFISCICFVKRIPSSPALLILWRLQVFEFAFCPVTWILQIMALFSCDSNSENALLLIAQTFVNMIGQTTRSTGMMNIMINGSKRC